MADPTPKKSAFDPDPPKVKAVPDSQREKSSDTSTPAAASEPDHVTSLRGSLRKFLGFPEKDPDFVEGGKGVSKAVDDALKTTPGNTADY